MLLAEAVVDGCCRVMATFYIILLMCYDRLIVGEIIRITSIDIVVVIGRRLLLLLLLVSRLGSELGSRAHHVVLVAASANGHRCVVDAIGV